MPEGMLGKSDDTVLSNSLMGNVTYLSSKSGMSYDEIMSLPYGIYLSLIEQYTIQDMMQSEEGRDKLDKIRKFKNPRKHADLSAIRNLGGYKAIKEGEN